MSTENVPETAPKAGLGIEAPRGMAARLGSTAPAPVDANVPQASLSPGAVVEKTPSVAWRGRSRLRPIHLPANICTFDAFRYRDYPLLWGATAFSSAGF